MSGLEAGEGVQQHAAHGGAQPRSPQQIIWAGVLGFAAGALCWHMIGFWGFVKEAVFFSRADGAAQAGARTAGPPLKTQSRQTGAAGPMMAALDGNCSLAGLNRARGEVQVGDCEGAVIKYRPSRGIDRADFGDFGAAPVPTLISGTPVAATTVSGWSSQIDTAGTDPKKSN